MTSEVLVRRAPGDGSALTDGWHVWYGFYKKSTLICYIPYHTTYIAKARIGVIQNTVSMLNFKWNNQIYKQMEYAGKLFSEFRLKFGWFVNIKIAD